LTAFSGFRLDGFGGFLARCRVVVEQSAVADSPLRAWLKLWRRCLGRFFTHSTALSYSCRCFFFTSLFTVTFFVAVAIDEAFPVC